MMMLEKHQEMPIVSLTERQRRFVEAYVRLGEGTKAAVEAGYSAKYAGTEAYRSLRNPIIKGEIERRLLEIAKEKGLTPEELKKFWASILNNDGEKTPERLKASELMARTHGMFKDQVVREGDTINIFNILPSLPPRRDDNALYNRVDSVTVSRLDGPTADGIDSGAVPPTTDDNVQSLDGGKLT